MIVAKPNRPTNQVRCNNQIQVPRMKHKSNQTFEKRFKKKTVNLSRQELVVPNESQSGSDEKSESQSESEKPATKP